MGVSGQRHAILIGKIQRPLLSQFLSASLLGVSAATRAENSGGRIGNDYNSDREHNRSENGRICVGHFLRYHSVAVTTNPYSLLMDAVESNAHAWFYRPRIKVLY
jgi:hypothetical protein